MWTLVPPEAFSCAADLSAEQSPRLTSLCSGTIVLPSSGMLTAVVFLSAWTHVQTHIYVTTYLWAHVAVRLRAWQVASCCSRSHITSIYKGATASDFLCCLFTSRQPRCQCRLFTWLICVILKCVFKQTWGRLLVLYWAVKMSVQLLIWIRRPVWLELQSGSWMSPAGSWRPGPRAELGCWGVEFQCKGRFLHGTARWCSSAYREPSRRRGWTWMKDAVWEKWSFRGRHASTVGNSDCVLMFHTCSSLSGVLWLSYDPRLVHFQWSL